MKTTKIFLVVIAMIAFVSVANAEIIRVTGTVTDGEQGEQLVGVSVLVKGTNTGTVTNVDGKYAIDVEKGQTLVFSYIGYNTKEVKATSNVLNVKLYATYAQLEETVVMGYGKSRKKERVGSVAKVSHEVMADAMVLSVTEMEDSKSIAYYQAAPQKQVFHDVQQNEEYGSFRENGFIAVNQEALSTFSLDVDAASYSNVRRILNQGQLPNADAVRVEEMVNYFSYNYPQPTGSAPVNIVTETSVCPWNTKHKIVRIGVKAREIASDNLPASNFVFLIDVSGSMYGATRLDLVKSSLKLLVNNLRDKDRVSIVVYAGAAGEVLPSTSGSDRQKIRESLDKLTAGGSTAGGAGIQLAYKIAEKNFIKGGNNRIILCTDGDFNVGVSSNDALEKLIESKRQTGVYLTILGYGMGNYKDSKLQTLSQKGNGNHAYIDNLQEANKVLVNEFGGTMFTVAKDVKLQVEFNPANVNAYRLVGYESRMLNKEDFNDDTKDAGELGAGHTVTALYEIIPAGVENTFGGVDKLKYQQSKDKKTEFEPANFSKELLTVKLRYKNPNEDTSKKIEVPVMLNDFSRTTSEDMKFAMSVAMFGQLLKNSDYKGTADYEKVISLAREGLGDDHNGYRREFVRLAEIAKQMEK
jgi:Uncharacterized protein containing a von Willebrand factor type A (vWA) domain